MTSERKRQANRVNAQASTGPKTAKGKKRSALNARRHGLNTSVLQDPFWGPLAQKDLEGLAQRFAGSSRSPAVLVHARRAAEAHLDLQRVRACRDHLVERALADPNFVGVVAAELKLYMSMRWLRLAQRTEPASFPEQGFAQLRSEAAGRSAKTRDHPLRSGAPREGPQALRAPGPITVQVRDPRSRRGAARRAGAAGVERRG